MYNDVATTVAGSAATGAWSIFSLLFCLLYCVIIVIGIVSIILWLWMLIDSITRKEEDFGDSLGKDAKVIWIILIFFTGWIGALLYYFLVYRKFPRR